MNSFEPTPDAFASAYAERGGVIWTRRISDLETPVSALIKLGADIPGTFLLESVQGGDFRGRYSIIGLSPDLVWRIKNGCAEISSGGFADADFHPHAGVKPTTTPFVGARMRVISRRSRAPASCGASSAKRASVARRSS